MLFQMFHVIYVKVLRIFRMSVSPLQSQEETYFFRAWIHNLLSDSVRVFSIRIFVTLCSFVFIISASVLCMEQTCIAVYYWAQLSVHFCDKAAEILL